MLRAFRSDDVAEINAIYADEWPRFRGSLSASIEETPHKIVEGNMAIQAEHGLGLWIAREKSTGAVVGDCGLQPLELRGPGRRRGTRG